MLSVAEIEAEESEVGFSIFWSEVIEVVSQHRVAVRGSSPRMAGHGGSAFSQRDGRVCFIYPGGITLLSLPGKF